MPEPYGGRRNRPLIIIVVANGVLAISQTNVASIYLPISITFNESIIGLGMLSSVFFVGYLLFEVPGNVYGGGLGPTRLALLGSIVSAVGLFLSSAANSFEVLVAFRFVAGVGFGIFFPPAIVLAIRNVGEASAGFGVALMTAAFSIGGALGVASWSVISLDFGWRPSLVLEGAITAAVVVALVSLPREMGTSRTDGSSSAFRRVLANRKVIVLGLSFFGSAATAIATGSFIVYYLEEVFRLGPGIASLAAGIDYTTLFFSGFAAGRLFDRGVSRRWLIFGSALAVTVGTIVIGIPSLYAVYLGSIVVGLAVGALTTAVFALAGRVSANREDDNMALAVVDSFSLGGLLVGPLIFPPLVLTFGYSPAWFMVSVLSTLFTIPVFFFKDL